MDLSKEKSGKAHPDILEIGEITAKKVSVFNSIKMETSMKVCGQWTRNTDKELTGDLIAAN